MEGLIFNDYACRVLTLDRTSIEIATCNPWHVSRAIDARPEACTTLESTTLRVFSAPAKGKKEVHLNNWLDHLHSLVTNHSNVQFVQLPRLESDLKAMLIPPRRFLISNSPSSRPRTYYSSISRFIQRARLYIDLDFPRRSERWKEENREILMSRSLNLLASEIPAEAKRRASGWQREGARRKRWKRHPWSDIWLAKLPAGWR